MRTLRLRAPRPLARGRISRGPAIILFGCFSRGEKKSRGRRIAAAIILILIFISRDDGGVSTARGIKAARRFQSGPQRSAQRRNTRERERVI